MLIKKSKFSFFVHLTSCVELLHTCTLPFAVPTPPGLINLQAILFYSSSSLSQGSTQPWHFRGHATTPVYLRHGLQEVRPPEPYALSVSPPRRALCTCCDVFFHTLFSILAPLREAKHAPDAQYLFYKHALLLVTSTELSSESLRSTFIQLIATLSICSR